MPRPFFSPSEEQEKLSKKHEKLVLSLNHMMEEKAAATVYINETYTKINLERKEIELQKQHLGEIEEQLEKDKEEYLKRKQKLTEEVSGMIYFFKKTQNCIESRAGSSSKRPVRYLL